MFGRPPPHSQPPPRNSMTIAQAVEYITRPEANDLDWSLCLRISDSLQRGSPEAVQQAGKALKNRLKEKKEHTGLLALQAIDSLVKNSVNSHYYFITKNFWKSMKDLVTDKKTPSEVRNKLAEMLQIYHQSFSAHESSGHDILTEVYNEWQKKGIKFPLIDDKKTLALFTPPTTETSSPAFSNKTFESIHHYSSSKERANELERALTADDLIKTAGEAVSLLLEVLGNWNPEEKNIQENTVAIEIFESCKRLLPQIQEFIQGGMISESKMLEMLRINDDFIRAQDMYKNLKKGRPSKPTSQKNDDPFNFDSKPSKTQKSPVFDSPIEALSAPPKVVSKTFTQPNMSDPFATSTSPPRKTSNQPNMSDPFAPSNPQNSTSYDPLAFTPESKPQNSSPSSLSNQFGSLNISNPSSSYDPWTNVPHQNTSSLSYDPFSPPPYPNQASPPPYPNQISPPYPNQTSPPPYPNQASSPPYSNQISSPPYSNQLSPPPYSNNPPQSFNNPPQSFNNQQQSFNNQPQYFNNQQQSFGNQQKSNTPSAYDPFNFNSRSQTNNQQPNINQQQKSTFDNYDPFGPISNNSNSQKNYKSDQINFNPWE